MAVLMRPLPPSARRGFVRAFDNAFPAILVGVVFLSVWEFGVRLFGIGGYLLPTPSAITANFFEVSAGSILSAARTTGQAVVLGTLLGAALGVLVAFVISLFDDFARVFLALAAILSSAPIIALAPIFNAWFGNTSIASKVAVSLTMVFFPVMINTARGLLRDDPLQRELMRSLAASRLQTMIKLRVPAALPSAFDGLRVGTSLSVVSVIVAEYFGGSANALGVLIANTAALSDYAETWAAVGIAGVMGVALYGLVSVLERIFMPWKRK